MALIVLAPGEALGPVGGFSIDYIFGTNQNEKVFVASNGTAIFGPSFNRGGDIIEIIGNIEDYSASLIGSNILITSGGGAYVAIPVGVAGLTVNFANASNILRYDLGVGDVYLGQKVIDGTSAGLGPPPINVSIDVPASESDPAVEFDASGDNYLFTSSINSRTDVVLNNFSEGDIIRFTGIDSSGELSFTSTATDIMVSYADQSGNEEQITLAGAVMNAGFVFDYYTAVSAVGFDFITIG